MELVDLSKKVKLQESREQLLLKEEENVKDSPVIASGQPFAIFFQKIQENKNCLKNVAQHRLSDIYTHYLSDSIQYELTYLEQYAIILVRL